MFIEFISSTKSTRMIPTKELGTILAISFKVVYMFSYATKILV